jgi:hypothetical protein
MAHNTKIGGLCCQFLTCARISLSRENVEKGGRLRRDH